MNYSDYTVPELDDILDEKGLKKTGLKADKIKRLEKSETPEKAGEKPEAPEYIPYEMRTWAGVKTVYACTKCSRQNDSKDDAIMHYLTHYPQEKQTFILDNLVKEG